MGVARHAVNLRSLPLAVHARVAQMFDRDLHAIGKIGDAQFQNRIGIPVAPRERKRLIAGFCRGPCESFSLSPGQSRAFARVGYDCIDCGKEPVIVVQHYIDA